MAGQRRCRRMCGLVQSRGRPCLCRRHCRNGQRCREAFRGDKEDQKGGAERGEHARKERRPAAKVQ